MPVGQNEFLFETIGSEPRLVAEGGRVRDFRKISSIWRGADRVLMEELIGTVVASGEPAVCSARSGAERVVAGYPVAGPDNIVAGVQVVSGADVDAPAARTAAFQWELGLDGPPRLHITPDLVAMFEIPEDQRDRSVYGPLDFFVRVARTADVVSMWETVVSAKPGDAESGTIIIQTGSGRPAVLSYAQRYVSTEVGPRLRAICQDVTESVDQRSLRIGMLDVTLATAAIESAGMYGMIVDLRWPTTCILKHLTPRPPDWGHGVSTGQTPGLHPDDIARVPGFMQQVLAKGSVRDQLRIRRFGGGWVSASFTARLIDPEVSKTIVLALVASGDQPEVAVTA